MNKPSEDVTTAEWVEAAVCEVLDRYSEEERDKTLPTILLCMLQEWGFDELIPKIQNAVQLVLIAAGFRQETTEEEGRELLREYVKQLSPNEQLLREFHEVFKKHSKALSEQNASQFEKVGDHQDIEKKAPHEGEKKPEDSLDINALKFPKRL